MLEYLSGIPLPILKPSTRIHPIDEMKRKVLIPQLRNIIGEEMMEKKLLETRLVRRHSQFPTVCIYCNKSIPPDDLHYVEEGITTHIHSLIARKYCDVCYTKYGEQILLHEKSM
jgi:uncharacterized protein with PIN domain